MHGPRQEETTGGTCSMGEGVEEGTERIVLGMLLGNKQAEAIVNRGRPEIYYSSGRSGRQARPARYFTYVGREPSWTEQRDLSGDVIAHRGCSNVIILHTGFHTNRIWSALRILGSNSMSQSSVVARARFLASSKVSLRSRRISTR